MPRLKREDREREIVAGAITFFAERGFSGQTRELARELGIAQPLLYRYFPSKQALIDRVHAELFLSRWDPAWDRLVADRDRPLGERIATFYRAFSEAIFSREWVRMFVFSGLDGVPNNRRVLAEIEGRILRRLCVELRVENGYPEVEPDRLAEAEVEYAWELHGIAFYYHLRQHAYGLPARIGLPELTENMAETFIAGAPAMLERTLGPAPGTVVPLRKRRQAK